MNVMDKEKLKIIIRNLELWVNELKSEIYSETDAYTRKDSERTYLDYDEIFEDDDGYAD